MAAKTHYERILVPYDFSDTAKLALEHTTSLVRQLKVDVILLHIVESPSIASSFKNVFKSEEKKFHEHAEEQLKKVAEEFSHKIGAKVQSITEVGKIYKKVCQVADENNVGLILMGTHGASGVHEILMGSNALKVVKEAPCPVISVQSHANRIGIKKILLPIDNSPTSRQKVPYMLELAVQTKSIVHILGLMTSSSEDFKKTFRVKIGQVEEYLANHDVSFESEFLRSDNLATDIIAHSEKIEADLIVMMTEQESTSLLLGASAGYLVNHSKIPVLSVRPAQVDPDKITVRF